MIMRMVDIHTHQTNDPYSIQIRNIFAQDLPDEELDFPFSAGLHPWDLHIVNPEQCMQGN